MLTRYSIALRLLVYYHNPCERTYNSYLKKVCNIPWERGVLLEKL
jgi:hypothetical protein